MEQQPPKESDKSPIVLEVKKKTGRKKKDQRVKFQIIREPVVLEFK